MLVISVPILLFLLAAALTALRIMRPEFRFAWLMGSIGAFLAWLVVLIWRVQLPLTMPLPEWKPAELFEESISFFVDGLFYPYALAIITLTLSILLTTVAREDNPSSMAWAGTLSLGGFGLLAVTADNPLTLVMTWSAIDIADLITQLRSVQTPKASERVVIAFSTRVTGTLLLLWANMVSISNGASLSFNSMPGSTSIFLVLAAGLRLGVLPLHLSYTTDSTLRRGFGTMLRLVSAASSLVLLSHTPAIEDTTIKTIMLIMSTVAGLYGGWMWLRATDELSGRPFWVIGMGALAISAALNGNNQGSVAWGCALLLSGGMVFLTSVQHKILNRVLLLGVLGLLALPFTLTAAGWALEMPLIFQIPLLIAQAMLTSGFIRHIIRPGTRSDLESMPTWIRSIYPAGILLLLITQLGLGLWGWDGSLQIGGIIPAVSASLLTVGLFWLFPRIQTLSFIQPTAIKTQTAPRIDSVYRILWTFYLQLGNAGRFISNLLEGESGMIWVVLFIALFISYMQQGLR